MSLKLVTPPAAGPVTVAQAKTQARVDHDLDDEWFATAIAAATQLGQVITGRQFVAATYELTVDGLPAKGELELPRPPLQSVEWVKYLDSDQALQTLNPELYEVDAAAEPGLIIRAYGVAWPATLLHRNAVTVRFTSGWPVGQVPEGIQQWMLIKVATHYAHREAVVAGTVVAKLPRDHLDGLLDPFVIPNL